MALRLDEQVLTAQAASGLANHLHGTLVLPGDRHYDEARQVWNTVHDRRPAAIVRVADAFDVARAIDFAREHALSIAVRGGGHSLAGHGSGDGALVIDMRAMRTLRIDPTLRRAWAGPGLTAGEYSERVHEHGLATPFGDTASVGIAGITLGGGIGYLTRRHGLTVDSLRSVDLVTADGALVSASPQERPELFWALRGGGGNFGVVTGLEFELHPAGMVYGGALLLPATRDVVRAFGPLAGAAPEELTLIANLIAAPPAPFVPADRVGSLVMAVLGVFAGGPREGERAFAPLRSLAAPVTDTVASMPYPAIYTYTAQASLPHPSVTRSLFVETIDDTLVDTILDFTERAPSPHVMTQIRVLGGAMARVPADATAFAHRRAGVMLTVMAPVDGPAGPDAHRAWIESYHAALRPRGMGAYVNFLEAEGRRRVAEAYPAGTYERLAAVKADYDPDNVFHLNQNILPAR